MVWRNSTPIPNSGCATSTTPPAASGTLRLRGRRAASLTGPDGEVPAALAEEGLWTDFPATRRPTARTNRNQAAVDQQVHNDRTANGGALNAQQKKQVNREQNQNSKQIYNEKHNNKTAKPAPKEPKK